MQTPKAEGKRILIVDDDQAVREMMKVIFAADGHSVTEAEGGSEALGLFRRCPFDLIVTDFEMPGMSGEELVDHIRRLAPEQRIIMVSANAYKLKNPLSKVNLCIDKPFLIEELRAAVSQLLKGR